MLEQWIAQGIGAGVRIFFAAGTVLMLAVVVLGILATIAKAIGGDKE